MNWRQRLAYSSHILRFGKPPAMFGLPKGDSALSSKQGFTSPYAYPVWRGGTLEWMPINYNAFVEEAFEGNSLVYEAIIYKARATVAATLKAYTGDPRDPDDLPPDHELSQLLARPNPYQNMVQMMMAAEVYLNVSGNCYIMLDRENPQDPLPKAMYLLRPDRVFIVPKKGGHGILGYVYKEPSQTWADATPILVEDMAHIKFPNPGDSLEGLGYGQSPLAPAAKSIDVDNSVTNFLKEFFDSGTMINIYISFKEPMDPEILERSKERFKEKYGGWKNWSEVAALDSGGEIKRYGFAFDEMDFTSLDERAEARIIGPFGVPLPLLPSKLGTTAATYSNIAETRRLFWQDTMATELKMFEVELQYKLKPGEDAFVAYDLSNVPSLQVSPIETIDMFAKLVAHGISKNEAARIVKLNLAEDIPDGEVIYMPVNFMPILDPADQLTDALNVTSPNQSNNITAPMPIPPGNGVAALELLLELRRMNANLLVSGSVGESDDNLLDAEMREKVVALLESGNGPSDDSH